MQYGLSKRENATLERGERLNRLPGRDSVDVSWNESWNGTEQMRLVKFEGKRMIMSTEPALGALDGKLRTSVFIWEKVQ